MKKKIPKKSNIKPEIQSVKAMLDFSSDKTDPQGSYTGCPANPHEKPVQDVDDL